MTPLVERLREAVTSRAWATLPEDLLEAADRISQLEQLISTVDGMLFDMSGLIPEVRRVRAYIERQAQALDKALQSDAP